MKCDEVFIVANINRVLSNKTVETSIKQWIGDVPDPHKNVVIVCTHADVRPYYFIQWLFVAKSPLRLLTWKMPKKSFVTERRF